MTNCKNIINNFQVRVGRGQWYRWIVAFVLVGIVSCKKFVQINPPVNLLATASVFDNDGTATSAQTAIYGSMLNQMESFYAAKQEGLLSDELQSISSDPNDLMFYTNSLLAVSSPGPWTRAYSYIYQANSVISQLSISQGASETAKKQLTGEAKFIRAFWYFYLTNCYGDVPLVTSTEYKTNAHSIRAPRSDVYEQIVNDLKDARELLNNNYVDYTDSTITTERVRPTRWAASSLLARTYLYLKKYDSAALFASEVLANTTLYKIEPNLNNVFLANSSEAIWQLQTLQPAPDGSAVGDGQFNNPVFSQTLISVKLLNSFEPTDQRRAVWIVDTILTGTTMSSIPHKYQVYLTTPGRNEYVMVLRLAEQYLIRAEARANLNDLAGATKDLNVIRERAGLADTTAADQAAMLSLILHERHVELFTEWGHRWFDLVRTGAVDSVLGNPANLCQFKGGVWNSDGHQKLFPIPQLEIQKDVNLTQNTGY